MAEACAVMKTLLTNSWIIANTDGKRPDVINAQDDTDKNNAQRIDTSSRDRIKIYENSPENRRASGFGAQGVWRDTFISLDVVTSTSDAHAQKLRLEVLRILETNYNTPGTGFDYIDPTYSIQPFSGTRAQLLWRWVFDVKLIKTNAGLGT